MSKRCCLNAKIELKPADSDEWVDVSDVCTRWAVTGEVGDVYVGEFDFVDREGVVDMSGPPRSVTTRIRGVDITSHVYGYRFAGRSMRLYVQLDKAVFRINGTHPWDDRPGQSPAADHVRSLISEPWTDE